ncbi:MAG: DUF11 domain-containing protein [Uliginosibacterium sp.]|nr:DUF11 domain-containing protein [Uliginosibacterium sp.]
MYDQIPCAFAGSKCDRTDFQQQHARRFGLRHRPEWWRTEHQCFIGQRHHHRRCVRHQGFAPGSIAAGNTSTLTITVYNRTLSTLTSVALTDNLPAGMTLAANPAATNSCGGTLQAFPGSTAVVLSGGSVAARPNASQQSSCAISIKVTAGATGTYANTIQSSDFSTAEGVTIADASANLIVTAGMTGSKTLAPSAITSGGTLRATITVNNVSTAQVTNLSVLDNGFSAGLAIANPANASTSCPGSPSIVANPGASVASLLGATLAAGGSCSFSFDLVTSGSGPWSNSLPAGRISTAEGLSNTATINSNSVTAQAAQININKSFNPVIVTGGVPSLLTIDVINPTSTPMSGVGFVDTFPPGIEVYSVPSASTDCSGGIVTAAPGDGKISLAKASLAANSTCHVYVQTTSVKFLNLTNTIPAGSVVGHQSYTNAQPTTASLSTLQGMSVMKSFSPAYMGPGQTTRLKLRLVSTFDPFAPSPLVLTGVSFTDSLPAGLTIASSPNASTDCTNGTVTATPGTGLVTISGVSLSPSTNCEISVDVVAAGLGSYVNIILQKTITTDQGVTNPNDASATLHVVNQPTLSKAFSPKSINAGQTSTLTVTINNAAAVGISGIQLADILPAGVAIAATPTASTTCTGGVVTALAGSDTLSLVGASLNAGTSCTFQAKVVANANGSYVNNINASSLITDQGLTNPGAVSDTLTVLSPPTISKAFSPVSIAAGGTSTLTIHLGNSNASNISLSSALVDALPGNVFVAATPNVSKTCAGAVTAAAGTTSISYANTAQIPPGGCDVSVDVTSATPGSYLNTIAAGQLVTTSGSNQQPATASLAVGPGALVPPGVSKAFSPAAVAVGGISQLTITLSNANASVLTLSADLIDTLPAGLQVSATPNIGGTCVGSVTANAGTQTITYANTASIPAGSCTITVDVEATNSGSFTTTIAAGALSTDGGSNPLSATASLVATSPTPPTVSKSFSPGTINPGGISRLTINLGNSNAGALTLTNALTDTLPANVLVAASPAIGGTCTLASVSAAGSAISYASGATIPAGGCTIQVDVSSATPGGPYTNTIPSNALQTDGGNNIAATSANLFVNPAQPPSISKSFSPTRVGVNLPSLLTISLANGNAAAATLTGDLVDNLPGGLVIATPPNLQLGSGCTAGKVVATAGGTSVTYQSGGVIPANSGCSISVNVVSAAAASYTNTIAVGALTTSIGNNSVSTSASLQVFSRPTVGKAFAPTAILEGASSTLTLTLGNSNASTITLSNDMVDSLPVDLVIATPNGLAGTCTAGKIAATAGGSSITYQNGASIPAGGCTIIVTVTSSVHGVYTNTIAAGALNTDAGSNTTATSATLTVSSLPSLSKAFSPTTILVNDTSTLTLSPANPNAAATTLTADLVDTMPTNLTVVTATSPTGTCTLSNVSLTSSSVRYASGSSIPSGGCTISVAVTSSTAANYVNTIPANSLQTNLGNHASAASASLKVLSLPTVGKAFAPTAILVGESSTLTLTLGNSNPSAITLSSDMVDSLPTNLVIATPNGLAGTCTAGKVVATAGGSSITYQSGASIPAGGCTIIVTVTSSVHGVYTNTIAAGALNTDVGANTAAASAVLTVNTLPTLSKTFSPTSILVNTITSSPPSLAKQNAATLTLTLTNPNAAAVTLVADLIDTMPSDLTVVTTASPTGTCTLANVVLTTTSVSYLSGSSIPTGGCTINVLVSSSKAGSYLNTIPANSLQTNLGNHATAASASLNVRVDVKGIPTLSAAMLAALVLLILGVAYRSPKRQD